MDLLNKSLVKISLITIAFLLIQPAISQQLKRVSINAMGSVLSNETLSLSQSIGQSSMVTKFKSEQTMLSQGFQQPNTFLLAGMARELTIQLYPNPNNGQFQFSISVPRNERFKFFIYDQVGRIVSTGNGEGNLLQKVDISTKTISGSYHLKIETEAGNIGNSKIIIIK